MNLIINLIFVVLFFSCDRELSPIKAEVVDLTASTPIEYALKTVELKNVVDIHKISGTKVKLFRDMRLNQVEYLQKIAFSSSFEELEKTMKEKMGGKDPKPYFLNRDGILRSQTLETLMLVSAYHHIDQILEFAKNALNPEEKITAKLNVGLYGEILGDKDSKVPLLTHDNALYIPGIDTVFLLRIGDQLGLPLAMHPGVLAHEFHHRIFFIKVWHNENLKNLWPRWQEEHKLKDYSKPNRSEVLLNATDEGLADLFAVAFTKSPSFLRFSLTSSKDIKIAKQRDLLGDFAKLATYDNLADSSLNPELLKMCTDHAFDFKNSRFSYYCLGTVLAKTIFDASLGNIDTLRNTALKFIFEALDDVAQALNSGRDYDMDILLSGIAQRAKNSNKEFFDNLCQQVQIRFTSFITANRVAPCKP